MKTEIILLKINKDNIFSFDKYWKYIDVLKQNRLKKYYSDTERALSFYADLIVRKKICERYNILCDDIKFEKNEFGKPFLKECDDFYFNISHSKDMIAIAFSKTEIGIDVEKILEYEQLIIKRFFSKEEQKYIIEKGNSKQSFYEIWTQKEAYLKYVGKGFAMSFNVFDTLSNPIRDITKTVKIDDYIVSVCGDVEEIILSEESVENILYFFDNYYV